MGILLKGGTLVELEPASVETADLRVKDGRVVARALALAEEPDDDVVDLAGKVVMPGLVSAHHHLTSVLLRGAPRGPDGFPAERRLLERMQDVLDLDAVEAAAAASALEGLFAGTTTVFDVHASPAAAAGSLSRVAQALNGVGLRAVLGYEVSDRSGAVAREEALEEAGSFAAKARGRVRGAVGVAGLGGTSDEALKGVAALKEKQDLFLLANLQEDREEEAQCQSRFGTSPSQRLLDFALVGQRSVIAQLVHVSWPDLSSLLPHGAWLAHASRSNMASQTGLATAAKFGVHGCLATDTLPLDVLAEAQAAWLRTRDAGLPIDPLRFLANGQRLAGEAFGAPLGLLQEGALADLVVLDARSPTPLTAATLAAHVVAGELSRHVESVMVDGVWRLWKRRPLAVEPAEVARHAREAAKAVWARLS